MQFFKFWDDLMFRYSSSLMCARVWCLNVICDKSNCFFLSIPQFIGILHLFRNSWNFRTLLLILVNDCELECFFSNMLWKLPHFLKILNQNELSSKNGFLLNLLYFTSSDLKRTKKMISLNKRFGISYLHIYIKLL